MCDNWDKMFDFTVIVHDAGIGNTSKGLWWRNISSSA
jgi:hypothetical protein